MSSSVMPPRYYHPLKLPPDSKRCFGNTTRPFNPPWPIFGIWKPILKSYFYHGSWHDMLAMTSSAYIQVSSDCTVSVRIVERDFEMCPKSRHILKHRRIRQMVLTRATPWFRFPNWGRYGLQAECLPEKAIWILRDLAFLHIPQWDLARFLWRQMPTGLQHAAVADPSPPFCLSWPW